MCTSPAKVLSSCDRVRVISPSEKQNAEGPAHSSVDLSACTNTLLHVWVWRFRAEQIPNANEAIGRKVRPKEYSRCIARSWSGISERSSHGG